jgi:hypothetical protein
MRAITNMRRRAAAPFPSLDLSAATRSHSRMTMTTLPNSALYNCLYILRHISQENKSSRGFGVDGPEEAYSTLRGYLLRQAENRRGRCSSQPVQENQHFLTGSLPSPPPKKKEYFVAVLDIEKCFDSVDTARLYDLLLHLLEDSCNMCGLFLFLLLYAHISVSATQTSETTEKYLIHKYQVTHYIPSAERFVTRTIRNVSTEDNMLSFRGQRLSLSPSLPPSLCDPSTPSEAYQSLANKFCDAVITDGGLLFTAPTHAPRLQLSSIRSSPTPNC